MDMDRRSYEKGRRGRNKDISDRFPQGGDEGISSGRMPGKVRDKDGDEGALLETVCKGRRDHLGGGKPPSSKMPTLRHVFPVEVSQWPSQEYRDVQEWGGKEQTATDGSGGKRQRGGGLRGLRGAVTVGIKFQISGEDPDRGGRRLAGGGGKSGKGQEELGETAGDT